MKSIKEWEVDKLEDKLIELLESFSYPVIRQGSLEPEDSYPDTFITFWNNSEYGESHYDNDVLNVSYDYDVNVYSNDVNTTYSLIRQITKLLKSNDWIIYDRGHDVPSDEASHTGRGINVINLNKEV